MVGTRTHHRSAGRVDLRIALLAAAMIAYLTLALSSPPAAQADEFVAACGNSPNVVFVSESSYEIGPSQSCPNGLIELNADGQNFLTRGENAIWQATAPVGLFIRSVWITSMTENGVNAGSSGGYGGDFYWGGGTASITPNETSAVFSNIDSRDFGFNLVCGKASCNGYQGLIGVIGALLTVGETTGPALTAPSGLWDAAGWIRGRWTLAFSSDSPSGMCSLSATLAGQTLPGSSSPINSAAWHQCAAPAVNDPVDTGGYPDGADTLQIGGSDAAGLPAAATKTLEIDNQPPTVALSGPPTHPRRRERSL